MSDGLILIPGGPFILGYDQAEPEERPAHQVDLPAYYLARVPVSNLQYLAFITAGGYRDETWWTVDGWKWRDQKAAREPGFWHDPRFNRPDQPVVGVCWYEALAYAAWLSSSAGRSYRLPSEAEWEKAARGTAGRLWPWGERFAEGNANVMGSGPGSTTAVGAYPQGATPQGILDLAGNVWEWTSSRWGRAWQTLEYPYPYDAGDGREDLGGRYARVMRGGSWFDHWTESRASKRARYLPGSRGSNIGFRLVSSAA